VTVALVIGAVIAVAAVAFVARPFLREPGARPAQLVRRNLTRFPRLIGLASKLSTSVSR